MTEYARGGRLSEAMAARVEAGLATARRTLRVRRTHAGLLLVSRDAEPSS
jgi:hypothetical protein